MRETEDSCELAFILFGKIGYENLFNYGML